MDVKELFNGIGVIIDNEIKKPESAIFRIKEMIENIDIPVVTYDNIPSKNVISSLAGATFIVLDWDFNNSLVSAETGERVSAPATLREDNLKILIDFIKELISQQFLPIFIFTALETEGVISTLVEQGLYSKDKPNRIFVKQKSELSTVDDIFNSISKWLLEMPSVYVLKEWEKVFILAKNKMFIDMYSCSPNWVSVIWNMIKEDSIESTQEFGEFVTKNLLSRIKNYSFCNSYLEPKSISSKDELKKIIEGERYIEYSEDVSEQAYTGDLFKTRKRGRTKYYLNIRAQCDLAREENPILYCVVGKEMKDTDIITQDIRITNDGKIHFNSKEIYDIKECISDEDKLIQMNKGFRKHRNRVFFNKGEVLEKKPDAIIICVDGGKTIKFNMDICTKSFDELKASRIGKILPPYITRIQQKCAQYIVREGIMPIPKEVFDEMI